MLVSRKNIINICPNFKNVSDNFFIDACNCVGIEVEKILSHPKTNNLEIAYIINYEKHPNADKLNIVNLKTKGKNIKVVCGASNLENNKYVILAKKGTKLYNGLVLENRNIRGVESEGMLCAYSELTNIGVENLSKKDKDGIIILDEATLGDVDIEKYINLDDKIYDLSIPSNRNDLNSIFCLLQELSLTLNLKFKLPYNINNKNDNFINIKTNKKVCSNIGFIKIDKLTNYKTNWKEKEILCSSGYKIHDNFLDFLNLVTINTGNPIHIYNSSKISDIEVSLSKKQKIKCLDGNIYEIDKNDIVVKTNNNVINIAGIIGSDESKFDIENEGVIIEVANFDYMSIRGTSDRIKLESKSSSLFSKPLSSWITQNAFNYICNYLKESKIAFKTSYDFEAIKNDIISFDFKTMNKFIGCELSKDFISKKFEEMNFKIKGSKIEYHPSRLDLINEFDIFEESLKFININKLEVQPIEFNLINTNNESFDNKNMIADFLVNYNFIETKTYNLVNEKDSSSFNFFNVKEDIKLLNSISNNREFLRKNLINSLLNVINYNISRKRENKNIFEIQKIQKDLETSFDNLTILFTNKILESKIFKNKIENNIPNIKSFIKTLFSTLNINIEFEKNEIENNETINNFNIIYNKEVIGFIGEIKKTITSNLNINFPVLFLSMDISELINKKKEKNNIKQISDFPLVHKDINVILNDDNIESIIKKIKTVDFIKDCFVKDFFSKDDKNIFTISIVLSSLDKTLTTKEIDDKILKINELIK